MSDTVNTPSDKQDLEWESFLYVSGEMSRSEAEAFESLLAEDQSAREAVATSVELLTTIATGVGSTEPVIVARRVSRPWSLVAAAITVAALVVICLSLSQVQQPDLQSAGDLVALWAESDGASDDSAEMESTGNGDDEDLAVPGWMLAAVQTAAEKTKEKD